MLNIHDIYDKYMILAINTLGWNDKIFGVMCVFTIIGIIFLANKKKF